MHADIPGFMRSRFSPRQAWGPKSGGEEARACTSQASPVPYSHQHIGREAAARTRTCTHRHATRRPPERDAVAVRVRDRRGRLVDRPELRLVVGVAVHDVQRLVRGAGHDALGGDAPVRIDELSGDPSAGRYKERGDVVRGAVAWEGCDEVGVL